MGAHSYWRECHIFEAHCGWNVPVGVAKPRRPEEMSQVYLALPFSITVRRCADRSAFNTRVIGGGGGGGGGTAACSGGAGTGAAASTGDGDVVVAALLVGGATTAVA